MPVIIAFYLAVGFACQALLFAAMPDWLNVMTWAHILLWPTYAIGALGGRLQVLTYDFRWLNLVLAALVLAPLTAVWLTRKANRRLAAARRLAEAQRQRLEPQLGAGD